MAWWSRREQPKRLINVGLDFGTSSSKVIWRDVTGDRLTLLGFDNRATGYGLSYVELSWARACVMLAVDRGDDVERILQRLASNAVIDSVRWSSLRWLASHYAQAGRRAESQDQVEQLQHEGGNAARTPFLLAQLDEAIAKGSNPAPGLMDELRSLQPGVIGHLLQVAPAGSEAQYVARFYPY